MSLPADHCAHTADASRYVLGQLAGAELERFLRHLRRCGECAEEVSLLQHVAIAPPLLGVVHLPPEEDDPRRPAPTPSLSVAAARARAARLAAERAPVPSAGPPPPGSLVGRPVLRSIPGGAGAAPPRSSLLAGRRLLKTPMPGSAVVGFLALGVLAVATLAMTTQAAGVRYLHIQSGWTPGGAALQVTGNRLELLVENMPRPAAGTGYQVWVVDRASGRLAATSAWVRPNELGQAGVSVPGDYHGWAAVAVYVEPLAGPDTSRSGAVVVGDLRGLH